MYCDLWPYIWMKMKWKNNTRGSYTYEETLKLVVWIEMWKKKNKIGSSYRIGLAERGHRWGPAS